MVLKENGHTSTGASGGSNKRKNAQINASVQKDPSNKRPRFDPRAKQKDARNLAVQTSSKAFKNGELDVEKFVKAREYEIRALEDGMSRSKKALTRRAFQQVPKDLRRRTASHNAKRVPKRLRSRAVQEMKEDNTPTVTARRRQPTRHMRLRIETAKRLRALAVPRPNKQKTQKEVHSGDAGAAQLPASNTTTPACAVQTRRAKTKTAKLAEPLLTKAKFRKRQAGKTWLPTHMFHAKRAHISPPGDPLWRFAVPLSPTAKCYRSTHRAANERGAIAWDASYFATIGIEGQQRSIDDMFKAWKVDRYAPGGIRQDRLSQRWQSGTRSWTGFVYERETPHYPIAPVTVVWAVQRPASERSTQREPDKQVRSVLVRVHPSAFKQVWEELVRLSKVVKPQTKIEDLRFEIGSIEISGPDATEALLGVLRPSSEHFATASTLSPTVEQMWSSLAGITDLGMLPANALLAMQVKDPRLQHPPRSVSLPSTDEDRHKLLKTLAEWSIDTAQGPAKLFQRDARLAAGRSLPSQKAINRRKSLAPPGSFPEDMLTDPKIPVLIYCVSARSKSQRKWVVLLPWKCVQPVWYSLMYYPFSCGGQPRFGGVNQVRQLAFEAGAPWFPGDFPGTAAGMDWEVAERAKRRDAWQRKPKSKRINWETLTISPGTKGEIGDGWACDWERLDRGPKVLPKASTADASAIGTSLDVVGPGRPQFVQIISASQAQPPPPNGLVAVSVTLTSRGVPQVCARIYRLPKSGPLRKHWLDQNSLSQSSHKSKCAKHGIPRLSDDTPTHVMQQRLARSLLEVPQSGQANYPACPSEEDLIGFVTSGNYNLGEGQGTAVGNILLCRVAGASQDQGKPEKWCIVRNAGSSIGRLATWAFALDHA